MTKVRTSDHELQKSRCHHQNTKNNFLTSSNSGHFCLKARAVGLETWKMTPGIRTCGISNVGDSSDLGLGLRSHQLRQHVPGAEDVAEVVLFRVPST